MTHVAFSADGRRLAYTRGRTARNAFRAPVTRDRAVTWADATQLTFDEAEIESIDVSRDGRILVSSDRGGNWDVWMFPAASGELQQLTTDPGVDAGPRWKPDGSGLVFYSTRTGHREVWTMPMGSGPARQLTWGKRSVCIPLGPPTGRRLPRRGSGSL